MTADTAFRVGVIIAAAATDYLDGWWARTRGPRTRTGALLDPIADKIFVVVALLSFVVHGVLATWQFIALLARDIFVAAGYAAVRLLRIDVPLEARFPGKVVTTLQLAAVLVLTLAAVAADAIVIVTAAAGAWAIADYGRVGVIALRAPRSRR
jgi:CDP-diacylglycerol--glycerol-3-phosphate 3-phosphatidyltransferase